MNQRSWRKGAWRVYHGVSAQQRSKDRRRRWTTAAITLFGSVGYRNTPLERLAAEARTSTRSFYQLFDSKEELLAAAVECCLAEPIRLIRRSLAQVENDDAYAQVGAVVAAYINYVTSQRRIYRLLYVETAHIDPLKARPDPLVIVLRDTLSGRVDGLSAKELHLLGAAVGGVVRLLLGAWVMPNNVDRLGNSPQEIFDETMQFCSPLLTCPQVDDTADTQGM